MPVAKVGRGPGALRKNRVIAHHSLARRANSPHCDFAARCLRQDAPFEGLRSVSDGVVGGAELTGVFAALFGSLAKGRIKKVFDDELKALAKYAESAG